MRAGCWSTKRYRTNQLHSSSFLIGQFSSINPFREYINWFAEVVDLHSEFFIAHSTVQGPDVCDPIQSAVHSRLMIAVGTVERRRHFLRRLFGLHLCRLALPHGEMKVKQPPLKLSTLL
eukprot:TRINITY_DN11864_c0_g1_i3.p1 TRINITY_DN11864_c0_g1~~TRINITY_DN11864_c0_g1_i3.p1  ORF type:complete len:119 (+),score=1.53 TRINITY_DN11864_c0_g1_i3:621-977(+)